MTGYTKVGPFSNGAAPGIDQTFLNGVETFLASVNNAATDNNVSSDGAGNETATSITANKLQLNGGGAILGLLAGTLSRIAYFGGTGSVTNVTHNLGATPTGIVVFYMAGATSFGTAPTQVPYAWNANTTTCNVTAQSGYSWLAIAYHL